MISNTGDYYKKQRMRALVRDSFTCQVCGETRLWKLTVHHVKPRAEGGTHDLGNLKTLCLDCHDVVHNVQPAMMAIALTVTAISAY